MKKCFCGKEIPDKHKYCVVCVGKVQKELARERWQREVTIFNPPFPRHALRIGRDRGRDDRDETQELDF